jgi:hypothetical protein
LIKNWNWKTNKKTNSTPGTTTKINELRDIFTNQENVGSDLYKFILDIDDIIDDIIDIPETNLSNPLIKNLYDQVKNKIKSCKNNNANDIVLFQNNLLVRLIAAF